MPKPTEPNHSWSTGFNPVRDPGTGTVPVVSPEVVRVGVGIPDKRAALSKQERRDADRTRNRLNVTEESFNQIRRHCCSSITEWIADDIAEFVKLSVSGAYPRAL